MDFRFVPEAARAEVICSTHWQLSIYATVIAISIELASLGFVLLNWDIVAKFQTVGSMSGGALNIGFSHSPCSLLLTPLNFYLL